MPTATTLQRICAFGQVRFTRSRTFSHPTLKMWGREKAFSPSSLPWVRYVRIRSNRLSQQPLFIKDVSHIEPACSATKREKNHNSEDYQRIPQSPNLAKLFHEGDPPRMLIAQDINSR